MRTKAKGKKRAAKTNITLKLDRATLKKMKILAAKRKTSISALVSAELEKLLSESGDFDATRKSAIARMRKGFDLGLHPRSRAMNSTSDKCFERSFGQATVRNRATSLGVKRRPLHPTALVFAIWSIDRKSAGPHRVNQSAYATWVFVLPVPKMS